MIGVLLSFLIFIYKYARQSNVRNVLTGAQCSSRVIRAPHVETKLRHLGQLLVVVELCRYDCNSVSVCVCVCVRVCVPGQLLVVVELSRYPSPSPSPSLSRSPSPLHNLSPP
jgi:hypothetical protein